jgi:RNA polymerase-binding transcription factor DksA
VVFRRHTGGLSYEELLYLSRESLALLLPKFERLSAWHASMRETRLTGAQAALLTVAAMKRSLIPPARFPAFFDSLGGEASEKYGDDRGTLWGWHAAATEIMNENSILTIVWKQDQLNYFMDQEAPALLARDADGSFELTDGSLRAIEQDGFVAYKGRRATERAELSAASAVIKRGYEEQKAAKAKEEKAKATKKAQRKAAREEAKIVKEERKAAIASSPKAVDKAFRRKKREISKRVAARAAAEGAKIPASLRIEEKEIKSIEEI